MESKKNKSRTYIVPLIDKFIQIHKSLLVDSYLFDTNKPELNNDQIEGIFILFRWSDNDVHRLYEQKLIDSIYTKQHYDVDTEHYMVYLKFPADIILDINLLIEGKYSKISTQSKSNIVNYWSVGSTSDLYGTLFKTAARKEKLEKALDITLDDDAELASLFNLHEEVFNMKTKVTQ